MPRRREIGHLTHQGRPCRTNEPRLGRSDRVVSKVSLHNQRGNGSAFTLRQQLGSSRACGSKQGTRNPGGGGNDDVINSNRSNAMRTSDIDYPFVADLTDSPGTGIRMNGELLANASGNIIRPCFQVAVAGVRGPDRCE